MDKTPISMLKKIFDKTTKDCIKSTINGSLYDTVTFHETNNTADPIEEKIERIEKIAEGGMSYVYRGKQHTLKRQIALKESKQGKRAYNQALLHESLIIARLEHPNIIPIYDLVRVEKQYQVVLKWLEGETLSQSLIQWRKEDMVIEKAIPTLLKICDALGYAHDQKIIHRDIKPDNIMISEHGVVYLLDWGVALDLQKRSDSRNVVVGTLCYMAPEMIDETPLLSTNEQSDIYLLGSTLHEILTGTPRHNASTYEEVVEEIIESPPKDYPPLLQKFGTICNKACHPNPTERYQTVKEFANALHVALDIWKQRFLLEQGLVMLEELQMIEQGALVPKTDSHMFLLYMQTRSAFSGYLLLDSDNKIALDGLQEASMIMIRHCTRVQEFTFAKWLQETLISKPS